MSGLELLRLQDMIQGPLGLAFWGLASRHRDLRGLQKSVDSIERTISMQSSMMRELQESFARQTLGLQTWAGCAIDSIDHQNISI